MSGLLSAWPVASRAASETLTVTGPATYTPCVPVTLSGTSRSPSPHLQLNNGRYSSYIPVTNGRWTWTFPASEWANKGVADVVTITDTFTGASVTHKMLPNPAPPDTFPAGIVFVLDRSGPPDVTLKVGNSVATVYGKKGGAAVPIQSITEGTGTFVSKGAQYLNLAKPALPGTYPLSVHLTTGDIINLAIYIPQPVKTSGVVFKPIIPITTNMPPGLPIGTLKIDTDRYPVWAYTSDPQIEIIGISTPSEPLIVRNLSLSKPGPHPFTVIVSQHDGTYAEFPLSLNVAPAASLAPTAINPNIAGGLTNSVRITPVGSTIAQPTVSGMSGPVTWALLQEADNRMAIDAKTGRVTVARRLCHYSTTSTGDGAMHFGREPVTLFATDGTHCCTLQTTVPIALAGANKVYRVGKRTNGREFQTIDDALNHWAANRERDGGENATIYVDYGIYTNDVDGPGKNPGMGYTRYITDSLRIIGVPDPATGKPPVINWIPGRANMSNGKAPFDIYGGDFYIEGFWISGLRATASGSASSHSFIKPFFGEGVSESITVNKCIVVDCDMGGPCGGNVGTRFQVLNSVYGWNAEGSGYSHLIYPGDPGASYLRLENCLFRSPSNSHMLKLRTWKAVLINNRVICANDGSQQDCLQMANCGELISKGNYYSFGPEAVNVFCVRYGDESYTPRDFHRATFTDDTFVNLAPESGYYTMGHNAPQILLGNYSRTSPVLPVTPGPASRIQFVNCRQYGFEHLVAPTADTVSQIDTSGLTKLTTCPPPDFTSPAYHNAQLTDLPLGPPWWPGNWASNVVTGGGDQRQIPKPDMPMFSYPSAPLDPQGRHKEELFMASAKEGDLLCKLTSTNGYRGMTLTGTAGPSGWIAKPDPRFRIDGLSIVRSGSAPFAVNVPIVLGVTLTPMGGTAPFGKLIRLHPV